MLWVAAVLFLGLRPFARKIEKWKFPGNWIPGFLLLVLGVWSLAYAPLPFGWGAIATLLGAILSGVFGWIPFLAPLATVVLVVLLVGAVVDLAVDLKPDGVVHGFVYSAPVLVVLASGSIALAVGNFVSSVGGVGPQVIAGITG